MNIITLAATVAVTMLSAGAVSGQSYPTKPIRIVTSGAGGGTDFTARYIAQGISPSLEQNVIVENRPSNLVGEIVAKAPPDGYTLVLGGGTFLMAPLLQKMPYDPLTDFVPISLTTSAPNILVVNSSLPVRSVKELIALAKARPGELNYAATGAGSNPHLAAELFKALAGVNIVRVAYKGVGPATTDLISGQVQVMFGSPPSVMPHVKSGRLRALAVTSAQPSIVAPGLPTVAAAGMPDYETVSIDGVLAPAKTPPAIVTRLNQEIGRVFHRPEAKEQFLSAGAEAVGSTPAEFGAKMKSEIARLGKVIKDAGIRAD